MGRVAKVKTTENEANVDAFINSVANEQKRMDSYVLIKLMQAAMNEPPKMWGSSLIGFGSKRYKSPTSGREVDWFKVGFSPRKANLSLYLMGLEGTVREDMLNRLGKYKTGGGCVYVNKLDDVDMQVLTEIINTVATINE